MADLIYDHLDLLVAARWGVATLVFGIECVLLAHLVKRRISTR